MRITLPAGLSPELLLTHPWVTHLQRSTPLPQPAYSCTKLLTDTRPLLFTPSPQFKCWLYSTHISFCIQGETVLFFTCTARKWAGLSRSFMLFFSIIKHCKWPIKIPTMKAEMEAMYFLFRKMQQTLLYTLQRFYDLEQHAWNISSSNEILLLSTVCFLEFCTSESHRNLLNLLLPWTVYPFDWMSLELMHELCCFLCASSIQAIIF